MSLHAEVEKVWTGINGKSFRGTFRKLTEDRTHVELLSTDGKLLTVALDNLIPTDREWIINLGTPAANSLVSPLASQFKPTARPSRRLTPSLDPETFGRATDYSLVDALWISLL